MRPTTTDDVLDLLDASFPAAALGAALEKGLFHMLAHRPREIREIAAELGVPEARCRYWLQLLLDAGLLTRGERGYFTSVAAKETILEAFEPGSWALLAEEARGRSHDLADLALHLDHPGPVPALLTRKRSSFYERMGSDAALARRFSRMLFDLHGGLADAVASSLKIGDGARVMDLGGGSGVVSLALVRKHPRVTAVVVDLPTVCAAGREITAGAPEAGRLEFHPANFLREELPGGFDVVIECDVNVYDEPLFPKIHRALKPEGRFVIVDQLPLIAGEPPPTRHHWAFSGSLEDPAFAYPDAGEIRLRMSRAGFVDLEERDLPLPPHRVRRFTEGMRILEGRRSS